jgi:DNA mismatch endonuclease (patch repair protein)
MARVSDKDSKAELALRRALHARGLRYRVHVKEVPGRPDLSIKSRRLAVFVDGDLWHGNPEEPRRRGRDTLADLFPTRTEWWVEKISRNVERDQRVNAQLSGAGWTVIRLWESAILADPAAAAALVLAALQER